MDFVLIVVVVATLLLALRTLGLRNLSEAERAELRAIQCPKCKANEETIMALVGLVRWFRKPKAKVTKLVPHSYGNNIRSNSNAKAEVADSKVKAARA